MWKKLPQRDIYSGLSLVLISVVIVKIWFLEVHV